MSESATTQSHRALEALRLTKQRLKPVIRHISDKLEQGEKPVCLGSENFTKQGRQLDNGIPVTRWLRFSLDGTGG